MLSVFRQTRRSERVISRSLSSSQSISLEDHEDLVNWEKFLKKELRNIDDDDFVKLSHYEYQSTSTTTRRARSFNHITHVENNDFVSLSQLKHQYSLSQGLISSLSTSRGVAQRSSRRDDRKLRNRWMIVKTSHSSINLYILLFLRQKSNVCSHCKIYQYDEKYRERFEK